MDYFIRLEYGNDYYKHPDQVVDMTTRGRSIDRVITDCFEQVVYSINQPAAARGNQACFWNISYYDKYYFAGMFEDFCFPDGTPMQWDSVNWLQKRFMTWFNRERLRKILTFPVETVNLLDNGKEFLDKEWADFAAEMWSQGHSFFLYRSDNVDSLASCCRLRNEIQDNQFSYTLGAGGVSTGSKCVMTININRIVQEAAHHTDPDFSAVPLMQKIYGAIQVEVSRVHKYLKAFNTILMDRNEAGLLPLYDAQFVAPDRQYLTVGINGLVEAAEFLGYKIKPDCAEYQAFVNTVLKLISDLNKADREDGIMFNTEYVPRQYSSGHVKPNLIDSELSLRQRGASVMVA